MNVSHTKYTQPTVGRYCPACLTIYVVIPAAMLALILWAVFA